MSAGRLANQMRLQALMALGQLGKPRMGLVTSYDPDRYAIKARLQPGDIETGWLPIATLMAGQGWGAYFGPSKDDQAVILFQEGDKEVGFCIGYMPSDVDTPPHVPATELHLIQKTGAFVKLLADGTVAISAAAGIQLTGPTTITGTLHVTDEVTADKSVTATTDVVGGGKHLKTHVHSGVTAGGGNTGAPV